MPLVGLQLARGIFFFFFTRRDHTLQQAGEIAAAVDVGVIAAGGIVDGAGIAAAIAAGACAAQCGTAFLTTPEASVPAPLNTQTRKQQPVHLRKI